MSMSEAIQLVFTDEGDIVDEVENFEGNRQPTWDEIESGQLLFYRPNEGNWMRAVVSERFDTLFLLRTTHDYGHYLIAREEFKKSENFVWLYDKGRILKSSQSRAIFRPWEPKRWNFHAWKKNWRKW